MTVRVGVDVGGTFTKAIAFDMDDGDGRRRSDRADHARARRRCRGGRRRRRRPASSVRRCRAHRSRHPLDDPGSQRAARGRRRPRGHDRHGPGARRPQGAPAHRSDPGSSSARAGCSTRCRSSSTSRAVSTDDAARDTVARLARRGAESIAVAEAFAPDDLTNEAAIGASRGRRRAAGDDVGRAHGPVRARTAGGDRRTERIDPADRPADGRGRRRGRGRGRHQEPGHGDARRRRRHGPRRAFAARRRARCTPDRPRRSRARCGRAASRMQSSSRSAAPPPTSPRSGAGARRCRTCRWRATSTAIRALDVRVLGVAGGSMLRSRRDKVYGVGPRSAHIAGPAVRVLSRRRGDSTGATTETIAPRPGDPAEYLVVRLTDGRRVALDQHLRRQRARSRANRPTTRTATPTPHAPRSRSRARRWAHRRRGRPPGDPGVGAGDRRPRRRGASASTTSNAPHSSRSAAARVRLGRAAARAMGLEIVVPENAEVISAIGDALSLVRAERERTFDDPDPGRHAGSSSRSWKPKRSARARAASTLDVRVEQIVERGAVRVTVTGAVGLNSGAVPGRAPAEASDITATAAARGYSGATSLGQYWLATDPITAALPSSTITATSSSTCGAKPSPAMTSPPARSPTPSTAAPNAWAR